MTSTAGFRRLDAASAPLAPQSRPAIRPIAARRSPTPSLFQWLTELRSPDSGRAGLASFVASRIARNDGGNRAAAEKLWFEIPRDRRLRFTALFCGFPCSGCLCREPFGGLENALHFQWVNCFNKKDIRKDSLWRS